VAVGAFCDRRSFAPPQELTSRFTAAVIPGARLVTVEGYDHNVPPEVLAPVLIEFFLGAAA
jgi:hypothetical protein